MHLCYEIPSLILLPLLPPLAATIFILVIIGILNLMIIASPALLFCTRRNPATSSPPSQWQVVSFGGGCWRHVIETPLWLANLWPLAGVMAGQAHRCSHGKSISLGHGAAPGGARYADCLEGSVRLAQKLAGVVRCGV
jgi:hypothetical protein